MLFTNQTFKIRIYLQTFSKIKNLLNLQSCKKVFLKRFNTNRR
jgi:hypothetical protein